MENNILGRKILYMLADSGATLGCGRVNDSFIRTGKQSTKIFYMPLGQIVQASKTAHLVRELTQTVDIVPGLQHNSLLSINKFAESSYITVFTPDKVTIFDCEKTSISSTQQPILQGWRDPATDFLENTSGT